MVEHLLAKERVVGSNPIFRSISFLFSRLSGVLAGIPPVQASDTFAQAMEGK